jgi:hypothetical protein
MSVNPESVPWPCSCLPKSTRLWSTRPALTESAVAAAAAFAEDDVLRLSTSFERSSECPVGAVLVEGATAHGLNLVEPRSFAAESGRGPFRHQAACRVRQW